MRNPDRQTTFRFKQFEVSNCRSAMKIGTDGVLLGAWAFNTLQDAAGNRPLRILDVGCGTGVLALMMAQRFPNAAITGIEISAEAHAEATENFKASSWAERLTAVCDDFTIWAKKADTASFDLIIANPPYFSNGELAPDAERRAARHEGALNAESLMEASKRLLAEGGRLAMVLPAEHLRRVEFQSELLAMDIQRLCLVRTVDRKAPRRILCELSGSRTSGSRTAEELTLQTPDGNPTATYRELVMPFYLNM